MTRYVIRRLLWAVVLFLAVTLVTFVIFYLIPVDPARAAAGKAASPAEIKVVAHRLYLDRPIYMQYVHFVDRLLHGDLGYSYSSRQHINDVIRQAAPITASLVIGGAILWMLIAIPIGVFSALKPRSLADRTAMIFVLAGISVHPVWLALVASYLFGYVPTTGSFLGIIHFPAFDLFPIQGYCSLSGAAPGEICGGPYDWAKHLILPWTTFAIGYAAFYVRLIRANTIEVLNEDFVRTARAKGVKPSMVIRSHVLRNAMLPVVTAFGMDIALAMAGAVLTELVFGLPGLGYTAIHSLFQFDYPVTLGVVVFASFVVIIANLAVDLLYAWIDPRIRLS